MALGKHACFHPWTGITRQDWYDLYPLSEAICQVSPRRLGHRSTSSRWTVPFPSGAWYVQLGLSVVHLEVHQNGVRLAAHASPQDTSKVLARSGYLLLLYPRMLLVLNYHHSRNRYQSLDAGLHTIFRSCRLIPVGYSIINMERMDSDDPKQRITA